MTIDPRLNAHAPHHRRPKPAYRPASGPGAAGTTARRTRSAGGWLAGWALALTAGLTTLSAQPAAAKDSPAADAAVPGDSGMDGALFYQLLMAEIQLRNGQPAVAYEVVLEAARRLGKDQLFRRAADIALQARSGYRALKAARAWREAHPESVEGARLELQILSALNRIDDAAEPLQALLGLTPPKDRIGLILSLPRFFQRAVDARQLAAMLTTTLKPHPAAPATRTAALTTTARAWQRAGDTAQALTMLRQAHEGEPRAVMPAFAALELMTEGVPEAETLVRAALDGADADPALRLAYARALVQTHRLMEAAAQAEQVTNASPGMAQAWLMLGAIQVEINQPQRAQDTLRRYLELQRGAESGKASASAAAASAPSGDGAGGGSSAADASDAHGGAHGDSHGGGADDAGVSQAWLLMTQAAQMQGDLAAAEAYLGRIDDPRRLLEVQSRRASLLVRQGKVDEALAAIRQVPASDDDAARARLSAEVRVLREAQRWQEAFEVLGEANTRWPDDTDLLYEQAMAAERIDRMDEMERLLRRVMTLQPDHGHAHNALGYSLADRNLRLDEARTLIVRALELNPGDPFITDSLGWVEFRLGRLGEAERLLREAYGKRPDVEIGVHLGEVLWAAGQAEEARRIWREVQSRDPANEVLKRTLQRLQPGL